jgi:hypothetical protein
MLHLQLIILSVVSNVSIDSETLLLTDFVNLKIKSTQSFRCDHRSIMYIYVFIGVSDRRCICICYYIFLKKELLFSDDEPMGHLLGRRALFDGV